MRFSPFSRLATKQRVLGKVLLFCSMLMGLNAHADWADIVRQMRTDTFTWRMRIVDASGQQVPAATLWVLDVDDKKGRDQALMERMVRRYAEDADFVQFSDAPGHFVVMRADANGELVDQETCICESRSMTRAYAAIKRGYQAKVVVVTVNKNSPVDVTIPLSPDSAAKVDPRMLEFDRLRAGGHDTGAASNTIMQQDRMLADRAVNQAIRIIAQSLEQDKQLDLASAVYYNLAYLPSVDSVVMPDGHEQIVGYTNGYSDRNPQRKADMEKAIALNQSLPRMKLQKFITDKFHTKFSELTPDELTLYLEEAENLIKKYNDKLWPVDYSLAIHYQRLGLFDKACHALKRSRKFEPTYLEDDGIGSWNEKLQWLNKNAAKAGYTGEACQY